MDDTHEPLSSFLILEYVDGKTLSSSQLRALPNEQRIRLYNSLADVYIQLRRLEFPSIGCLIRRPDSFEVCKRTTTIDINMQELEGLHPSQIQVSYYGKDGRLTSANDYVTMLLAIGYNAFIEGRSSVVEKQEGEDALYHLDIFQQYAEQWKDGCLDQGPFALVHGDLELHNLLVNEDGDILSVLDWEWSRVVPLQFFKPPLWLGNSDTTNLAYNFMYQDYTKKFNQLLDTIRIREKQRYGDTMLADEWAVAKADSGFLVANALENWTDMDWFAHRYINWKLYRKIDLNKRVEAFMEEDPARVDLIERKVREGAEYETKRLVRGTSSLHTILQYIWPWKIRQDVPVVSAWALSVCSIAFFVAGTSYVLSRRLVRFPSNSN